MVFLVQKVLQGLGGARPGVEALSAPKEVWLSSDGILFKSVSINAYRAQVHSEDVRYVLAESVEAETASLRAQLAEATKQAETDRQHALRLFRDLHATSEERDALRSQLAEARAAAPRWVPVTERLPEFGETVLVPGGLAFLRASGGWYSLITDRPICWEVRHWMPLTSAPAQAEER